MNDTDLAAVQEAGLPFPTSTQGPEDTMPPGGGQLLVPHFQSFASIVNSLSRTYRWTYDEALRHSPSNALAIRRDPVIMDALRARQLPTAQLAWHLQPQDEGDQAQIQMVQGLTADIEAIPNLQRLMMHLLEAIFYGRYGVQLAYQWEFPGGRRRLRVRSFRPVNGDKIVFKFSGQPGVLIHSMHAGKFLTSDITDRGRAHFLDSNEREQFMIHHHEPEDADFFEGELAGAVFGVGIRSRLYWFWWLKQQIMSWLMDYLEKVGAGGLMIYFYEAGNPTSLTEVTEAAKSQASNGTILFPRLRDNGQGGPGIMPVSMTTAGASLLEELIVNYFDSVIRRYILGQTLSSDTASTGLGSGVAELHADTFARVVKYDAISLAETLTSDLVKVLCRYNHPGVPPPRFQFDVDKPNAREMLEAAKAFFEMGGEVDADELRSIIGLSAPAPGKAILSQMPQTSPMGVGALPQGVPVEGQPGPDPQAAQGQPAPQESPVLFNAKGDVVQLASGGLAPDPFISGLVEKYTGQKHNTVPYLPLDESTSYKIADHYHNVPHAPNDPKVRSAYDAFKKETKAQYDLLKAEGIHLEPWTGEGQPYKNSAEMIQDARGKKHLYFYTGGDMGKDNHLAEPSGESHNGSPLTFNDLFRAVHDYFGHAHYGNQFGPRGEEHAWRVHSQMYSPQARPAMSFETRGQNSWVNYGPHLRTVENKVPTPDHPTYVKPEARPFAEQKNNLLPDFSVESK